MNSPIRELARQYLPLCGLWVVLMAAITAGLVVTGCMDLKMEPTQYIKVPDRYPNYSRDIPPKALVAKISEEDLAPLKPEVRQAVLDTVNNLKAEAMMLRSIVDTYQAYAAERNLEFDAYLNKKK